MPIKNYTTTKDVHESLGEIQGVLAKNGARKIMVDYDTSGNPVGVTFAIETQDGPRGFILPANVDGVVAAFARQRVKADRKQAQRTAWRNVRDWIMAQLAFIEAGNVEATQVFLPYMTDGKGRTVYELYQNGQLALGAGKGCDEE